MFDLRALESVGFSVVANCTFKDINFICFYTTVLLPLNKLDGLNEKQVIPNWSMNLMKFLAMKSLKFENSFFRISCLKLFLSELLILGSRI